MNRVEWNPVGNTRLCGDSRHALDWLECSHL